MNVPDHFYSEIVKLNRLKFKSNPLVLQEVLDLKQNIKIVHQINKTQHINSQIITLILPINMNSSRNTRIINSDKDKNNNKASKTATQTKI